MYCTNAGNLNAFQSGTDQGVIGTYVAGDALAVVYDGVNVRWLKNGLTLRIVALASSTTSFFFDSSFYHVGGTLQNIMIGPLSGVFDINTLQITPGAVDVIYEVTSAGPHADGTQAIAQIEFVPAAIGTALVHSNFYFEVTNNDGVQRRIHETAWIVFYNVTDNIVTNTQLNYISLNLPNGETWKQNVELTASFSFVASKTYRVYLNFSDTALASIFPTANAVLNRAELVYR
jgi:hypothetical protein